MISRLFIGLASGLLMLPVGATTFELADEEARVIGHNLIVYSRHEDTLLDIGRKFDLGYTDMVEANPNLDPRYTIREVIDYSKTREPIMDASGVRS